MFVQYAGCENKSKSTAFWKKKYKNNLTEEKAFQMAITCLSNVLAVDVKPNGIEIGMVSKDRPECTMLEENDIEDHLTKITEKD